MTNLSYNQTIIKKSLGLFEWYKMIDESERLAILYIQIPERTETNCSYEIDE